MKLAKNQIQSRRNGLIVSIPNTNITSNLMQRFNIKGENELVFDQTSAPTRTMMIEDQPIVGDAVADAPKGAGIDDMI